MADLYGVYKCEKCGNIVEVLHEGVGTLVCCGEPMVKMQEKTGDTGTEKHTPVIERNGNIVTVKVGSIPHPMEEKHWIEWISLLADGVYMRKVLKPGEKPEAVFVTDAKDLKAWSYCNLHGLWKSE
ncbi:superoxide reductase [Thermoanaerobacter thermohydrosulfuricus]|mgnify:CR=1 FL=1|uniref:Desulfoferrodoxin n=4 Tax=Thermoanaerobacter TaxID=1754 RepID=I9KT43_9THEO|nr:MULTISPECIES: desulfoferrodoxin [Thermoanaerobacter]EGD52384.1 desulfoferrodoxin [Thermoanaerobacter ethanolicus JW 200]HHY79443.1 desulfoferrodoxin [Thermoanaerobacter sp.]AEM79802.1 desulfoferrodoxin [Thermoanaerobacter wiegelii Rt8.B1]EIV99985.1 desulfoferrodoxin [Thermoanaerobacter siderophilus SR4]EMT39895.1 desulfoferrodoxin [Thermoanaerobacter thermohydrosulfuricus WC1]